MSFKKYVGMVLKPAFKQLAKRSLPQTNGSLKVQGLVEPVEIDRDGLGIPHVKASTQEDLFFAQGFVHAQDRLFQMDLNRRVATGTLSEILGEISVETDKLARQFEFSKLGIADFESMETNERAMIKAYVKGINAYLTLENFKKPIEYSLIGSTPKQWTIEDVMAFSRFMIWQMSHAWFSKIVKFALLKDLDSQIVDEWEINAPPENEVILPHGVQFQEYVGGILKALKGPFLSKSASSNSIVVAGHLTEDGKPLLANDVHLALSTPSLWYEIVLNAPDILVAGASIPGLPMVLIGQNRKVSWGITLAYTDAADVYLELVNIDAGAYFVDDKEKPMRVVNTKIPIKRKKGKIEYEEYTFYKNHRGVIFDPTQFDLEEITPNNLKWLEIPHLEGNWTIAFSIRDFALRETKAISGWYRLNKATNWNEFVKAMEMITAPQLNFVYADEQNIGYWCTGQVPKRDPPGIERYPLPGWVSTYDFNEIVPFEEMPHALNPKEGFIITANNRVVNEDYPHYLGNSWMNGYRATRIKKLLTDEIKNGKITPQILNKVMMDIYCIPAKEFVQEISNLAGSTKLTNDQVVLVETLKNWDFSMDKDLIAPTVYEVLRYEMVTELFSSILGMETSYKLMGLGFHPVLLPSSEFFGHDTVILLRILRSEASETLKIYSQAKTLEPTKAKLHLVKTSLANTSRWLKQHLGAKPSRWTYGRIHKAVFPHALSLEPMMVPIFNAKPIPINGNTDTPYQTAFHADQPFDNNAWSISFRMLSKGGDLVNSMFTATLGQSENIASKHFSDIASTWIKGKYHHYNIEGAQEKLELKSGN